MELPSEEILKLQSLWISEQLSDWAPRLYIVVSLSWIIFIFLAVEIQNSKCNFLALIAVNCSFMFVFPTMIQQRLTAYA